MSADLISDVYVAGRWRPARSDGVDTVVNPTTEEAIARVVRGDGADVDAAVRAAGDARTMWATTPVATRCALVVQPAEEIEARAAAFTALITTENGDSSAAAPFCGHKDSGLGVEFGPEGIAQFLSLTSIHRLPRRVT
ncbi:MAG: aldehyde dehydrogenase [Pseudonocardiales bacterium]|jgi:acyl-CoA reductase-like NAD-dependent aldehyde dehydrogenase|nr:aldehyde dehydrogenase [Pseudonocardiales bacterium]